MTELPGFRGTLRHGVPLAARTTWHIGGPAEFLANPVDLDDLLCLLATAHARGLPLFVLGRGSNVLIDDAGLPGITVQLGAAFAALACEEGQMCAGAGVPLPRLAAQAARLGYTGFEHLAGIPGSVGAGVVINAGAAGRDMRGMLSTVTYIAHDGRVIRERASALELDYRDSKLKRSAAIVIDASFELARPAHPAAVRTEMQRLLAERRRKFPLDLPNAGSVFKRPAPDLPAGRLIETAGLKGVRIGDAQVSSVHANFIVNLGRATARDIKELIELVRTKVRAVHGIELEREVVYLPEERNR